jgi:diguanylate cyclase (GGDEF)-like protein
MLDERLPDEVERARRYGSPLCLVVFDVDYFKSVNDAFGHSRGDAVLRELVQRVQAAIRSSDILFRYGGDEFAIVLPNTPRSSGVPVAQRVLDAVTSGPFLGHPPLSLGVSLGLAVFPDDASAARPLFEAADFRNRLAKRSGRGCVVSEGVEDAAERPLDELSRLIERDEALASAQGFLDRVAAERRNVLRIAGGSGMGKTRLLSEVIAAARLRNHLVVHLRGSRASRGRPYGAWIEGAPASLPAPETGHCESIALALDGLRASHQHAGVVVACDDLPELDFSSFELVAQLLASPALSNLGVAYTVDRRSARSVLGPPGTRYQEVELEPLSTEGTLVWLRGAMQWEGPADFVHWLHQATGGAPRKLQQAVHILRERGTLHRTPCHEWTLEPTYMSTPLTQKLRGTSMFPDRSLPPALTDFVGREVEQAQVNALLDRSRLVSLVGPGGIGKTRLSLEIARGRADDFADGVRFVTLASAFDPALVPSVVAAALGVRQTSGKTVLESLTASLRDKDLLLVLDNFEQVVAAAPFVSHVMTEAPGVRVLVTSREPLRISGEHVYPVPALPLPAASAAPTSEEAQASPAIALFVLRAQAVSFDFRLGENNARDVVELCRRLDGLPLAIEIAAARVDRMSPREILAAESTFLGAQGPRDLPQRQQTMRNVIGWSYAMLDRPAQIVFSRLSVFAAGAAPEAVAAACDSEELEGRLARILGTLADKSLVVIETRDGDEPRYGSLATIRSFAAEQLAASGEELRVRDRHADHYGKLAGRLNAVLGTAEQRATLDRFEREYANIRAALAHLRDHAPDAAAGLALALGRFWEKRGDWAEGFGWVSDLARAADLDPSLRARCLHLAGRLARLQGERETAMAHLGQARDLAEARGEANLLALVSCDLGCTTMALESDYAAAHALLTQSLGLFRKVRDELGAAEALRQLGLLAYYQGEHGRAEALCGEALGIARRRGDPGLASSIVNVLGLVARARGDYATAAALLEEHLRTCEWLDDKHGMMDALWNLAEFARSRGDFEKASAMYQRYTALCREVGNTAGTASALKDLGEVARYMGRYDEAAVLYDRALALLEASGYVGDIPWVQRAQAEIAMHAGRLELARALYLSSLGHHRESTHPLLMLLCVGGLSAIAAIEGDLDRAARLVGASERLFKADGALLAVPDRADYERRVGMVKDHLDARAFETGRAAGGRMSPPEVMALAFSHKSAVPATS